MPTIGNMPHADVRVEFPDGEIHTVNLIVLLAETLNAEFKARHGYFLPGVNRQHPTLAKLRDKYQLSKELTPNWKKMAMVLRYWYTNLSVQAEEIRTGRIPHQRDCPGCPGPEEPDSHRCVGCPNRAVRAGRHNGR